MNFEKIDGGTVYEGNIMKIVKDRIRFENGQEAVREVSLHRPAAAVLPETSDGKILLVRQYRYAVGEETLEIPAGLMEENETPEENARRELEEETGYIAGRLTFLYRYYSSPGFCSEVIHVFLADKLIPSVQNLDPDEFIEVVPVSLEEALRMIRGGEIADGKTISAISYVAAQRRA